jgi:hypothetical protein
MTRYNVSTLMSMVTHRQLKVILLKYNQHVLVPYKVYSRRQRNPCDCVFQTT